MTVDIIKDVTEEIWSAIVNAWVVSSGIPGLPEFDFTEGIITLIAKDLDDMLELRNFVEMVIAEERVTI